MTRPERDRNLESHWRKRSIIYLHSNEWETLRSSCRFGSREQVEAPGAMCNVTGTADPARRLRGQPEHLWYGFQHTWNSVQRPRAEPRRTGRSHQFQSGPCYLRQCIADMCCLFPGLQEMNWCHQPRPGKAGTHRTNEQLCAARSCWSLVSAQAVTAAFLHVYEGSHGRKMFPWLGSSHLSHISSDVLGEFCALCSAHRICPLTQFPVTHPRFPALLTHCQNLPRWRIVVKSERQNHHRDRK